MQEITGNEEDLRDSVDSNASQNFVASWASDNLTSKAIALRLDARFNPVSNNTQKLDIGLIAFDSRDICRLQLDAHLVTRVGEIHDKHDE